MHTICKGLVILSVVMLAACQPATPTGTPAAVTAAFSPDIPILPTSSETPTSLPTIPPSTVEVDGAEVPPGFSLIKFADVPRPTSITFDTQGRMFVASQDDNLYLLRDDDKDGRADSQAIYASGHNVSLGVAVQASTGDVYLSHQGRIIVLRDTNGDDKADTEEILVADLPFGKHQNDNLKFGPDGWLYVGVGSTCNACDDPDPRSASIMRFNVETGESQIFATGLRNPFDLAFQPETGQLFATDNGRDDLGLDTPFEELNHIVEGGDYGYPNCWDLQDAPGCENSIPAIAFFEAHSSANGLDFYNGQSFPTEYRGNAFVSILGLGLKPEVQTGVQRVVLSPNGDNYTGEASWFVRLPKPAAPLPLLFGPDDALYVGDYVGGVIYRISYGLR